MHEAAHFLHVVSALGLAAAFGVESAGLIGLRRANDADEALLWLQSRRWVLLIGPASTGLVLATGIYMTVVEWGPDPWILVSLASLVTIAGIGASLTGIPMAQITPAVQRTPGPLPEELRRALRTPLLTISINTRITITAGIVFLMVLKPALLTSLLTIVLAITLGLTAGLISGIHQPSTSPTRKTRQRQ
ncbi:MAG TPA: hypothetical protein VFA45_05045 [Actinomycetes bacterium]|nr:hypothetical protein [Actinomycetes bacterium]